MANTIYGTTDRTQGVLNYTVSTSATQVTITLSSALQAQTYYLSGYRLNTVVNGSVVATNAAYVPNLYGSFTTFLSTTSVTRTFARGKSAYTVSIGSSYVGEMVDGYLAGGKSGSTSINISIPALASYAVTYDANGGSGAPTAQTKWYNETLKLSATVPTRPLYNFLGWGVSADDTTVDYAPGASYTANSAITLYAIWELAYTKPLISNVSLYRSDSTGTALDDGAYASVNFDWSTFSESFPVSQIEISYKTASATTWTDATTLTPTGTSGSVANQVIGGSFDIDTAYNIKITVQDSRDGSDYVGVIPTAFFTIDIDGTGKAVGFGVSAPDPTNHTNGVMAIGMDLMIGELSLLDFFFPVGTVLTRDNHTSPASLYGGTWELLENTFLYGVGVDGTTGDTGGASTHTLTVNEMPSHTHQYKTPSWLLSEGVEGTTIMGERTTATPTFTRNTVATGGGAAHNNMPPYTTVSIWRRTA